MTTASPKGLAMLADRVSGIDTSRVVDRAPRAPSPAWLLISRVLLVENHPALYASHDSAQNVRQSTPCCMAVRIGISILIFVLNIALTNRPTFARRK